MLPRYYLELNTKQRKEWEQRLEELKKASEEEVCGLMLAHGVHECHHHNAKMVWM